MMWHAIRDESDFFFFPFDRIKNLIAIEFRFRFVVIEIFFKKREKTTYRLGFGRTIL